MESTKHQPVLDQTFWENSGLPIAVAHRGGDTLGIEKENSLVAVDAAIKLGYTWFETDVVPTSDGKLLAIHGRGYQMRPNRDLPRRRAIQHMTYSEVKRKLRIGNEPVPLFEELLHTFPDTKWFIDPKVAKAVEPLADILKQPAVDLDRISVGAFSQKRTSGVAEIIKAARGRDICTAIGPLGAYAILASSDVKLDNLEPRDRFLFRYLKWSGRLINPEIAVETTGATSIHVPYRWINNSTDLVEVAHSYGLRVASWTPNQPSDIAPSIEKGVDAIMSDNVRELKKMVLADSPHNASITVR